MLKKKLSSFYRDVQDHKSELQNDSRFKIRIRDVMVNRLDIHGEREYHEPAYYDLKEIRSVEFREDIKKMLDNSKVATIAIEVGYDEVYSKNEYDYDAWVDCTCLEITREDLTD